MPVSSGAVLDPLIEGETPCVDILKVVVAAKSTTPQADLDKLSPFPPDPNSPQSTITTVAREIALAGGEATAIPVDTTNYASIQQLVAQTIQASHPSTAHLSPAPTGNPGQ